MKPTNEFRKGLVKAAVFERDAQGKNGKFKSQSVAFQTSYQDKDGEWQNRSVTIVKKNLLNAIAVLQQAAESVGLSEEAY